jgi:tetratricopeptide (TPR) repeat protein
LTLNRQLNVRVTALTRFTLGLMYDLVGAHQDALEIFKKAMAELDLDENSGQDVFYYFLGRSALFQKEDEEAEAAFKEALASTNNRYTRGYLGLGSVHFRRTQCRLISASNRLGAQYDEFCRRANGEYMAPCQLTPPECQTLIKEEMAQTLDNYQRVVDESVDSSLKITARLSLGLAHRLQGDIARTLAANDEADALYDKAVVEIQAVLTSLEAAGQYRYLGQAYQSLGYAYTQQAQIREGHDQEGSIILYRQAREAFADCIAQQKQSPYDETLAKQIVAGCKHDDGEVSAVLDRLQGEQQ